MVRSVERAIAILEVIAGSQKSLALGEISSALRIPKSTTLNIVRTLGYSGILEFDAAARTYRMSPGIVELASRFRENHNLPAVARKHLEHLAEVTQEAVFFSMPARTEITVIDKVESAHPIRFFAAIGARRPLHCTAAGKLTLALAGIISVDTYVTAVGLKRFTARTIVDVARLRRELEMIRRRGYSVSDSEYIPDSMGIAAPVVGPRSTFVGAVNVAGPSFRIRRRQKSITSAVRSAARTISAELARLGDIGG